MVSIKIIVFDLHPIIAYFKKPTQARKHPFRNRIYRVLKNGRIEGRLDASQKLKTIILLIHQIYIVA